MPASPEPPLPPGYYLDNFEFVLKDVAARYRDLLQPGEAERLAAFLDLPLPARRLLVRMFTRRGPWFRPETFAYPEIEDIPGALATLLDRGFCAPAGRAAPAELVALLRRPELEAWLGRAGLPCPRGLGRDDLAGLLLRAADGPWLQRELAASLGAVAPLGTAWVRLLWFLFFGSGERDLSDFVLADLGRVRYEAYPVDPRERLFRTRADVDFLLALGELREAFEAAGAAGAVPELERITGLLLAMEANPGVRQQRRFHRLLNAAGRDWERRREPDRALACYARSQLPPARERRIRVLATQGAQAAAEALALEASLAPLDVAEERFASRFLARSARRPGAAIPVLAWREAHPEPPPVPELRLRVARHPSGSVELAALEAARAAGWDGWFCENALWNGLFGLALWDQLFAPVPGAFQHRLQAGPADLGSPEFHARRAPALAARFLELAEPGALARELLRTAEAKRGIANTFVNWRELPPDLLAQAVAVLPAPAILSVLRTLAPSPLALRSGFPDLLLWHPEDGRCRLWEVKGPGDALRPEQERWLNHFNREGLEARIAWVSYL